MPRHPVGADLTEPSQRLLDVEHPLMHMWAPPVNFEKLEAPDDSEIVAEGSPADRQPEKHAAWKTWCNGFSEIIINAWSSDTIMGYLEKDLRSYLQVSSKWQVAWEQADDESMAPSTTESLDCLHRFMAAVRAVGDLEVFTAETWADFTKVFKPARGASKEAFEPIQDMLYMIKSNPEWKQLEADAVQAASTELHGRSDALAAMRRARQGLKRAS